jgi:putative transposase
VLPEGKRAVMEPAQPQMSIVRQCDVVGLPRSTSDDQEQGESEAHLPLLRLREKQSTDTPYYGVRRLPAW